MGAARNSSLVESATVIAAARAMIARDGMAGFSIKALAAETGVARSTLHRRFGGKRALIASIVADDAAALTGIAQSSLQSGRAKCINGPAPETFFESPAPADAWLERRLRVLERALTTLEARQEKAERSIPAARLDETLNALSERLTATEARLADTVAETERLAVAVRQSQSPRLPERARLAPLADARIAEPELPFIAPAPAAPGPEETLPSAPPADFIAAARRRAALLADATAEAPIKEQRDDAALSRRIIAILAFAVLLAGIAITGAHFSRARAMAATSHRHVPASAVEKLAALADSGDPAAQYQLGTADLKTDPALGLRWLAAAAAKGNAKAMHNLAVAYVLGEGASRDVPAAIGWFTRAASLGYVDSAFDLAVLYERGEGVAQSLFEACKWYAVAASLGDAPSAARLDVLKGQMTEEDFAAARQAANAFMPIPGVSPPDGASRPL